MAQGVKVNLSKEELAELLKRYTQKEIAELKQISIATVRRYKKIYELDANLELARQRNSEKHTVYSCDINYFNKIDTFNKAYLLGFICADGFVTDRNEVGICVATKDKAVVEFFQKELKSNKPIREIENDATGAYELRIQNSYLAETIKKYGVVPRKSLIINIEDVIQKANLSDEQISVFLLGYFDGDGSISLAHRLDTNKEYFEMNVTGTYETIQYYKKYFGHGTITKRHHDEKNNYTLQLSNNFLTIYNCLSKIYKYKDRLDFFFERKYNLFEKLETRVKS